MHNENRHFTLPNMISFARICFIPPFVICVMQVQHHDFLQVYSIRCITYNRIERCPGWLSCTQIGRNTNFGKYLDPIADKLLLIVACILLSSDTLWPGPRFPVWVLVIIISRELFFSLGVITAFVTVRRRITWQPSKLGKLTTFLQITAIIAVLLGNHISLDTFLILWFLVAGVTLISAINYTYMGVRQL